MDRVGEVTRVEPVRFALEIDQQRAIQLRFGQRRAYRLRIDRRAGRSSPRRLERQQRAPASSPLHEQRVGREREGSSVEIGADERTRVPGGLHVGEKRAQALRPKRKVCRRRLQAGHKLGGWRQCLLPRLLAREARKKAGRRVESAERAGVDQALQLRADPLRGAQYGLLIGIGHDDEVTRIGRADVGAQRAIQRQIARGHRAQRRELRIPQCVPMASDHGDSRDQQAGEDPAQRAGARHHGRERAAQERHIAYAESRGQQRRQHEASDPGRDHDSRNGIKPKLSQPGETGEQQRGEADDGRQHPQSDRGPESGDPLGAIASRVLGRRSASTGRRGRSSNRQPRRSAWCRNPA